MKATVSVLRIVVSAIAAVASYSAIAVGVTEVSVKTVRAVS